MGLVLGVGIFFLPWTESEQSDAQDLKITLESCISGLSSGQIPMRAAARAGSTA